MSRTTCHELYHLRDKSFKYAHAPTQICFEQIRDRHRADLFRTNQRKTQSRSVSNKSERSLPRETSSTWMLQTKCHELHVTNCLSDKCHKERRLPHECYKLNVTNYMKNKEQISFEQIRGRQRTHLFQTNQRKTKRRGGGLGSSTIFKNLMSPTPRRKWYLTTGRRAH